MSGEPTVGDCLSSSLKRLEPQAAPISPSLPALKTQHWSQRSAKIVENQHILPRVRQLRMLILRLILRRHLSLLQFYNI
jgi:hypothetical protein